MKNEALYISIILLISIFISGTILSFDSLTDFTGSFTLFSGDAVKIIKVGDTINVAKSETFKLDINNFKKTIIVKEFSPNEILVSIDNKDYKILKGETTQIKSLGANFDVRFNGLKNAKAILIIQASKKVNTVPTLDKPLDTRTIKKQEPNLITKFLNKFKKNPKKSIDEKIILKKQENIELKYPVYAEQNKIISRDDLFQILFNKKVVSLLSESQYGRIILSESCRNNQLDAELGESDVDCGGPCQSCEDYRLCNTGNDCKSLKCQLKDSNSILARRCLPADMPLCTESSSGVELSREFVLNGCKDERTVIERNCISNDLKTYSEGEVICPPGKTCQNGQCIGRRGFCIDNDVENNNSIIGIAIAQNTNEELGKDYCLNDYELKQVNCVADSAIYGPVENCGENEICSGGVCLSRNYCEDPEYAPEDSSLIPTHGEGNIRKHIDSCISETRVRHIVCDGISPKISETDCPGELVCNNGLCGGQLYDHCIELEWGAIDKDGNRFWNGCSWNSDVIRRIAKCFPDGNVDFVPEPCMEGVCEGGECVRSTCEDSDGRDPMTSGNVETNLRIVPGEESKNNIFRDYCEDNFRIDGVIPEIDSVEEEICRDGVMDLAGNINSVRSWERVACEEGQICINELRRNEFNNGYLIGSCVENSEEQSCEDSDSDINIFQKGTTSTSRRPDGPPFIDRCRGESATSTTLVEYSCRERGYVGESVITCPNNPDNPAEHFPYCDNGACSKGIDEDPNNDIFKKGYVTDVDGNIHPDFCRGGKVIELSYNRETGELIETEFECPEGTSCSENDPGRCS
ncbi:hypothetical protein J4440_04760 [Candidatus Woesearchaeota archaeon]|nr:hypothetical protein [Candidatus Woesearchaeota archaeon]